MCSPPISSPGQVDGLGVHELIKIGLDHGATVLTPHVEEVESGVRRQPLDDTSRPMALPVGTRRPLPRAVGDRCEHVNGHLDHIPDVDLRWLAAGAPTDEQIGAGKDLVTSELAAVLGECVQIPDRDPVWRQIPGNALKGAYQLVLAKQVVERVVQTGNEIECPQLGRQRMSACSSLARGAF